jgi:SAM-dependent methyltransferase
MTLSNQNFNQEASAYLKPRRKESFDRIIEIIKNNPPQTLLDIGCASGDFLFQLLEANLNIQAIGIDKSSALIKLAKKRLGKRPNPQFHRLDILSPKDRPLLSRLLKTQAEVITILGTLHTFHDFTPILQPLISNPSTKKIIIHSPFNPDPVNVRVFHQDLSSPNKTYQSGYNIFSITTVSRFLKRYRVKNFKFIPFVMDKTLIKNPNHPMFNYHLIDKNGKKWLTNGAGLIFQEYILEINLR